MTTFNLEKANENWSSDFEKIKQHLEQHLKPYVCAIEHIGSTAVADLAAKPVIDIQCGVQSFDDIEAVLGILQSLGFVSNPKINQDHVPFHDTNYFESGWEKRFCSGQLLLIGYCLKC